MVRVAYLIGSHTNPRQVGRLAKALLRASRHGSIVIHHDPRGETLGPADIPKSERIMLVPQPEAVSWGDFSQVRMFLNCTRLMLDELDFDWIVWISGQDYPLGPLGAFEERLETEGYDGYMRFFEATDPGHWGEREGRSRYYYQYYPLPRFRYWHRVPEVTRSALTALRAWFNDIQPLLFIRPRYRSTSTKLGVRAWRHPFRGRRVCFGGWNWVSLSRLVVIAVQEFTKAYPGVVRFYQRTFCPDESFLQTVVLNDKNFRIRNDAARYVHWSTYGAASPDVIRLGDLPTALDSGAPFGRKFDDRVDAKVLDALDERIGFRE